MNISEPVEKSVLSAKAKDILLNKGIVTIGELFSAKGKQFSEIINENSDIAKELEGFIRRNAEQAERAGISIDYDLWLFANEKHWFAFGLIYEAIFIILLFAYLMIDGLIRGLLDWIDYLEMCVAFVFPIAVVCFIPSMILAFVGYHTFNKNITNKEKL